MVNVGLCWYSRLSLRGNGKACFVEVYRSLMRCSSAGSCAGLDPRVVPVASITASSTSSVSF
jgi:hypothetical protein